MREVYGLSSSKLAKGLKEFGLAAKDIDKVILTHLHFDHSGGCTKIDRSGGCIPCFQGDLLCPEDLLGGCHGPQ